ncbi:hypothetical protein M9Y10_030163 [Tritrichomonas musculus]|uniref:Uncharacterized protein n=1 Tax=Tritrichomonas musculus TaxID=1915356 RepID=A0ABR2KQA5_9EUKA
MQKYANKLYKGIGIEMNKEEAARFFKKDADLGEAESMFIYGDMLYEGDGIEMNKEDGLRYITCAADNGCLRAKNYK